MSIFSKLRFTPSRSAAKPVAALHQAAFEPLEDRRMLDATLISTAVEPTRLLIVVEYTDPAGINAASLGNNDVAMGGPNNYAKGGRFEGLVNTNTPNAVRAQYSFESRGGAWNYSDNGTYNVALLTGGVAANSGATLPSQALAQYNLWFTTPRAEPIASFATDAGFVVAVRYSDNVGIDAGTLDRGTVQLVNSSDPNNPMTLSRTTFYREGERAWVVEYRTDPRGGAWDYQDSGAYTLRLSGDTVRDSEANSTAVPAQTLASYNLFFSAPRADLVSQSTTPTSWLITVRFSDDTGIDLSTITSGDIIDRRGSDSWTGRLVGSPTVSQDGRSVVATYDVRPVSEAWSWRETGTHVVSSVAGSVRDNQGNNIGSQQIGSFYLFFSTPSISTPAGIAAPNATSWEFEVRYTDNVAINTGSIGSADLGMIGPSGYVQNASFVSSRIETDSGVTVHVARYRFTALPGSNFANGTYNIFVNPNQVFDTSGNAIPNHLWGSFYLWFPS